MREIRLDKEKILTTLDRIFRIQVGEGDLTTELVEPYGKFARFGLFPVKKTTVYGLSLVDEWITTRTDDIETEINLSDGESAEAAQMIMTLKGNGKNIITLLEFLNPILSGLSRIYEFGISLLSGIGESGFDLVVSAGGDPCYSILLRYTLEKCGFRLLYSSAEDSVFIRPVHIEWVGDVNLLLNNIGEQLGSKNHGFRIQVEVNSPEQFSNLNENDFWRIHLRGLSMEEIESVMKNVKYPERIVIHIENPEQLADLGSSRGIRWICPDIPCFCWDERSFKTKIIEEKR